MPSLTTRIRPATAADYGAYAALSRELGVDDPTPSSERFAFEMVPRTLVYERDGTVLGYVKYDTLAAAGYIRNLVVAPAARRAGIGAALLDAAAIQLRSFGVTGEWRLNVKSDNAAAIKLYERFGMHVEHRSVALRFAWSCIARLTTDADAERVTTLPVYPGEEDEIERELEILSGRLQMTRIRPGYVTLQLRDAQLAPVGVACFDPAYPGAFPFCVARPALAAPLLRALAPHARRGDLDLQIIIEDDDALADALIAAGATVRMHLLHYSGPLPTQNT